MAINTYSRLGLTIPTIHVVVNMLDNTNDAQQIYQAVQKLAQQRSRGIEFEEWFLPPEFEMGGRSLGIDELLQPSKLKREYRLRPLVFGLSRAALAQLTTVDILITAGLVGWTQ